MTALELATAAINEHGANQWLPELTAFTSLLMEEPPARQVLEIGSQDGGTLWLFAQLAATDASLISVDYDHGQLRDLGLTDQRLHLVSADSLDPATVAEVQSLVRAPGADLVFIDGNHGYEEVLRDWRNYGPMARPGGLVAFHDVRPCADANWGAWRAWQDIAAETPDAIPIIDAQNPHPVGWGIGVVRVAP